MTTHRKFVIIMYACIVLLIVQSCVQTNRTKTSPAATPAITLIGKSPDDIFTLLNESAEHFSSLQISGEFEIKDRLAETSQKCSCLILIKRPNIILIKGYQALIPNYFTFIIKNNTFTYYIPRKDIVYQGSIEALKNNKDYTLSLDPELMLPALIPQHFSRETHSIEPQGNTLFSVAAMRDEGAIQTIARKYQFAVSSTLPRIIEILDSNGVITATITFTKPTVSGDITYPKAIMIVNEQQQTEILFSFKKLIFNSELPDRLFTVDIPEGVTIEEIKK